MINPGAELCQCRMDSHTEGYLKEKTKRCKTFCCETIWGTFGHETIWGSIRDNHKYFPKAVRIIMPDIIHLAYYRYRNGLCLVIQPFSASQGVFLFAFPSTSHADDEIGCTLGQLEEVRTAALHSSACAVLQS